MTAMETALDAIGAMSPETEAIVDRLARLLDIGYQAAITGDDDVATMVATEALATARKLPKRRDGVICLPNRSQP